MLGHGEKPLSLLRDLVDELVVWAGIVGWFYVWWLTLRLPNIVLIRLDVLAFLL